MSNNDNIQYQFPVEHLSYSALGQLVENPQMFKKQYILGIWDNLETPAWIVGKAFHKFLEVYYDVEKNHPDRIQMATQEADKLMEKVKDSVIKFGATGSREKMRKNLNNLIQFYLAEEPEVGEVLHTELSVVDTFQFEGSDLIAPLPIKAKTDLVTRINGKLVIWDYKSKDKFSDKEGDETDMTKGENPEYILQAMFNYYTVKTFYKGEAPERFIFVEAKYTKNKEPERKQLEFYEIRFADHPEYFRYFKEIYTAALRVLINPDFVFLPNFRDRLKGKQSWNDFINEITDLEMPKMISHRLPTQDAIQAKDIKFVQSSVENENLLPQDKIVVKLREFGISLQHHETFEGASVIQHQFKIARGVKMSTVDGYENDLKLALEATSVRIQAPIPGTNLIGVEVGKKTSDRVILNDEVLSHKGRLIIPVGQNVYRQAYTIDLAANTTPHLLVAGTTGSGKSVFLNTVIKALIKQNESSQLRFILIDPKQTEFSEFKRYSDYLVTNIISDTKDIIEALNFAVEEMEERYKMLESAGCKTIDEFNATHVEDLPHMVIVVDELADLMLNKRKFHMPAIFGEVTEEIKVNEHVEVLLTRLAQKARAAGIHLILATQRPSVDVIKGVLKANLSTRVAFRTASRKDSEVILDKTGAEELLGNGDLLLLDPRVNNLMRLQGYIL